MCRQLAIVITLVGIFTAGVLLATIRKSEGIPAWTRKYNADCAMCHYPAVPRLNSFGQQFRRAGFRTPDEFGKDQDVTKIGDYFATRLRGRFGYENQEGQVERSEFTLHDATFFYAGPLSQNFSAFVESEIEGDGEVKLIGQFQGVFGNADRFVSIRIGQMHTLQRVGVGGFDRPTGISTNPVHASTLTRAGNITGSQFSLSKDQKGIELALVKGGSRLLGQILNGLDQTGSGENTRFDIDPDKDYLVAFEHLLDDIASGFTVFYYKGTQHLLFAQPILGQRVDFSRVGMNISKVFPVGFGFFELQGGFVRSYDNVPGDVGQDVEGNAFYVESQQFLSGPEITFLERYSLIDQDTARKNTLRQDFTVGVVMPVQTWLRAAAEYTYMDNRATGNSDHAALFELMANW